MRGLFLVRRGTGLLFGLRARDRFHMAERDRSRSLDVHDGRVAAHDPGVRPGLAEFGHAVPRSRPVLHVGPHRIFEIEFVHLVLESMPEAERWTVQGEINKLG